MSSKELLAKGAFVQIVRKHRKAVFSLAYGKVRNVQDAEDITQEVFAEAYRNIFKLVNHQNALGWLMKATTFRCKDHVRKMIRRRRRETHYADLLKSSIHEKKGQTTPDGLLGSGGLLDIVAKLPEKYRTVLVLKHFAMLSYDEISRMTGLSKTTIDGRLRSAKKELKARLTFDSRS